MARPKHKKARRYSGGITIFCKEGLRRWIKNVKSSEGFIWTKLDAHLKKHFLNAQQLFLPSIHLILIARKYIIFSVYMMILVIFAKK